MIDNWNDDSILSRNGYKADGSQSEIGRRIVLKRIVDEYDFTILAEVISHFRWLIEDRGYRMPNAKRIWERDLRYFCESINVKHSENLRSISRVR